MRQANRFQKLQRGFVDALHVSVGEGLILPAHHAGAYRGICHRNGTGTKRAAGFTATAAAGKIFHSAHFFRLLI